LSPTHSSTPHMHALVCLFICLRFYVFFLIKKTMLVCCSCCPPFSFSLSLSPCLSSLFLQKTLFQRFRVDLLSLSFPLPHHPTYTHTHPRTHTHINTPTDTHLPTYMYLASHIPTA